MIPSLVTAFTYIHKPQMALTKRLYDTVASKDHASVESTLLRVLREERAERLAQFCESPDFQSERDVPFILDFSVPIQFAIRLHAADVVHLLVQTAAGRDIQIDTLVQSAASQGDAHILQTLVLFADPSPSRAGIQAALEIKGLNESCTAILRIHAHDDVCH